MSENFVEYIRFKRLVFFFTYSFVKHLTVFVHDCYFINLELKEYWKDLMFYYTVNHNTEVLKLKLKKMLLHIQLIICLAVGFLNIRSSIFVLVIPMKNVDLPLWFQPTSGIIFWKIMNIHYLGVFISQSVLLAKLFFRRI